VAQSGVWEALSPNAAGSYYNLLVQGFRVGQLSLKKETPVGFAQLADPYDPAANALYRRFPYRLHDPSYYNGRLYLYFGVTPALMLFWPFVALTGQYLSDQQAVAAFCSIGLLAGTGLLHALWRRNFAEVSIGVVVTCALALGLATGVPVMLTRCEVYQVAISCGYMLTMLVLAAIWCALQKAERRCWWLAAASVAYGLAVGARPSLLFGAVILLVPVAQAWRERRPIWAPLLAATGPIALIGIGLALYNSLRFDSPFEFGWHCQLTIDRQVTAQYFRPRYLWFNLRVYLLAPVHWSGQFPFMHQLRTIPPVPGRHRWVERSFGILTNTPLVWLALAAPLAWRDRSARETANLRWFLTSAVLWAGICAVGLSLLPDAFLRYEVEFLPELVLVAVVGMVGLERMLAPIRSGLVDRSPRRSALRWGWGPLLGFSVAFNLLASVEQCAEAHNNFGIGLVELGRLEAAIGQYDQALRLKPDFAEAQNNLGNVLAQLGAIPEALGHYGQALRVKSDYAEAHNDLAVALMRLGRVQEAIEQYQQALRIKPDYVEAQLNLGIALEKVGRVQAAIGHYEQALRIKPDFVQAQNALARARAAQ
jgi:tetratricopeptide (TPR) repeat protein